MQIRILTEIVALDEKGIWWSAETEDGTVLRARCRQPFCQGARELLKRGADPEAMVVMRHVGADHDSFEPTKLGVVADLRIEDSDFVSAVWQQWKPMPDIWPGMASGTSGTGAAAPLEEIIGGDAPEAPAALLHPPQAPHAGETSDGYAHVVAWIDVSRRIVRCKADIQFIAQERKGGRWKSASFFVTRAGAVRLPGRFRAAALALFDRSAA